MTAAELDTLIELVRTVHLSPDERMQTAAVIVALREQLQAAERERDALRQVIDNAMNADDYAECLDFLRTAKEKIAAMLAGKKLT